MMTGSSCMNALHLIANVVSHCVAKFQPQQLASPQSGLSTLCDPHIGKQSTLTTGSLSPRWTVDGLSAIALEATKPADKVLAAPQLGTTELWTFTSDFHHPVHIHLGHFQVLSRNGRRPGLADAGWKDTVDIRPYEVVEVLVRFTGYRGRYVLHCHNLEHEDMAMMANFDIV